MAKLRGPGGEEAHPKYEEAVGEAGGGATAANRCGGAWLEFEKTMTIRLALGSRRQSLRWGGIL
jgi:hypothetical protein